MGFFFVQRRFVPFRERNNLCSDCCVISALRPASPFLEGLPKPESGIKCCVSSIGAHCGPRLSPVAKPQPGNTDLRTSLTRRTPVKPSSDTRHAAYPSASETKYDPKQGILRDFKDITPDVTCHEHLSQVQIYETKHVTAKLDLEFVPWR